MRRRKKEWISRMKKDDEDEKRLRTKTNKW